MSSRRMAGELVHQAAEEIYLKSATDQAQAEYDASSDAEKRQVLRAHLQKTLGKTKKSEKWAKLILDQL